MLFPLILILCSISAIHSDDTLELLHVIFRHGDRNPTEFYANDPYKDYKWPGGLGSLTNKGKLEMFNLGIKLREEYYEFLDKYYLPNEVVVESSYAERCQMSAQCLLAGLFPPRDKQIWNKNLLWQPIPVSVIPRHLDNKITSRKKCPVYDLALKNIYNSSKIQAINKNNEELYKYLSDNTGNRIDGILPLELLYNTLEIEQMNNLTLPNWTKKVFPDKMKDLAALSLAVFTETELMKRLHGGPLVKEIWTQINERTNYNSTKKIYLYAAHDTTIVNFLRTLGLEKLLKPEFGVSIIVEYHKLKEDNVLKIYYRKNAISNKEEIFLPKCSQPCKISTFYEVLRNIIPDDWEKECNEIK